MAEIGVIGAGSWGTALALLLDKNGHAVTIWSHLEEEADELSRKQRTSSKASGSEASGGRSRFTTDLKEAC